MLYGFAPGSHPVSLPLINLLSVSGLNVHREV